MIGGRDIFVFGCGGHAKVVTMVIKSAGTHEIRGYVDVRPEMPDFRSAPVIEEDRFYEKHRNVDIFVAVGDNDVRKKITVAAMEKGDYGLPTFVHPSAHIGDGVTLGNGVLVLPHAVINDDARVGNCCVLSSGSVVEHNSVLEDFVSLAASSTVSGSCHIGLHTYIGAGAVVRNGIRIGRDCVVGCGAAVVSNIESGRVYAGVPAKELKRREFGDTYL